MGVALTTTAWAPGRVNIIGEHIDYNGGKVLPMAIHLGCTATVDQIAGNEHVISSSQRPGDEVRIPVSHLAPGVITGWAAYPAGALWALIDADGPAMSVHIDGEVPAGAGLSSSASVECAVASAVNVELHLGHSTRQLAVAARRAENEFVGVPTGPMDQTVSMLAHDGHALLFDTLHDTTSQVPLNPEPAELAFLVIDTRAAHALVDGGYAARRASCERAAAVLDVPLLRMVEDPAAALDRLAQEPDGDLLVRRARHVFTEMARVDAAVVALLARDFARLGSLMNESHDSLRQDYAVSCPELDLAVTTARATGALGARMTGGGFGGSALALAPAASLDHLTAAVMRAYAEAGYAAPAFHRVRPSGGARILSA